MGKIGLRDAFSGLAVLMLFAASCSREIVSVYSATNKVVAGHLIHFVNDSLKFSADFFGDARVYSKIDGKSYTCFRKILEKEFPDIRINKNNFLVHVKYDEENVVDRDVIFCLRQKAANLSVKMNDEYQNSSYVIYPFNASNQSYLYISRSLHPDSLTRTSFLASDAGQVAGSIRFDADYETSAPEIP
ncbi:MAG: hypothetical protein LBJ72_05285 [Dysgonamonadaceae bacterium]|jgi:hypothetical protein|nr:hypothetical protein [Dysgonamonadaceae bacterium]